MISKQEIQELLDRGPSGQEAARLVLLDSVEVDHGRPGLLTSKDLEKLKRSLLPEEASVYNLWVYAYQITGYSLLEARGHYLEARLNLERVTGPLTLYALEAFLQTARKAYPLIWTEKQLQENAPPEGRGVAIIQNPDPELLDDRGYYTKPELLTEEAIRFFTAVRLLEEEHKAQGIEYLEALMGFAREARAYLRALKAYHQALEELSSLLDVNLTEDFVTWWGDLELVARQYNRAFTFHGAKIDIADSETGEKISQIRLKALKPDPDTLDYMRDRIAMAMGPNWQQEASHGS